MCFEEQAATDELSLHEAALDDQLGDVVEDLRARLVEIQELNDGSRVARVLPIDEISQVLVKSFLALILCILAHEHLDTLLWQ